MIHFVVGTRAQLFKFAPIMLECEKRKLKWRWVYTAQHKETMEETLRAFGLPKPDYTVFEWDTEAKTMGKIWYWFMKMLLSLFRSRKILAKQTGKSSIVLTHGDTLTTWIAALYGRLTRTPVMHVESGLRSFNIFKPFPEEINRLITFRLSTHYAAPGKWALNNLKKYRGTKINTVMNTQIDTISFGLKNADKDGFKVPREKYAVVSIHRYENIFNKDQFIKILGLLENISKDITLLFVQHPATKIQIDNYGVRERIKKNKNIQLLPRLEYLSFIKCIKNSEYVITDGGGNQEELYHIGKPTLLFRNETERKEGLGTTAVISKFDEKIINDFVTNYKKYRHAPVKLDKSPSEIIVNSLMSFGEKL